MFSSGRRMSVSSKSESCTGLMSNSRSFSSSLSTRSSNSPSRFVFGAKRKVLTKSPSAFSANEMRSGVLRKVESASQRARSHSRMRAPQRTAWSNDFDTDSESTWDRNYRIRVSRSRCPNDFDQNEFDSFFEWVMERESSQPQQRRVIADDEHDKRIAQIRHLLFK